MKGSTITAAISAAVTANSSFRERMSSPSMDDIKERDEYSLPAKETAMHSRNEDDRPQAVADNAEMKGVAATFLNNPVGVDGMKSIGERPKQWGEENSKSHIDDSGNDHEQADEKHEGSQRSRRNEQEQTNTPQQQQPVFNSKGRASPTEKYRQGPTFGSPGEKKWSSTPTPPFPPPLEAASPSSFDLQAGMYRRTSLEFPESGPRDSFGTENILPFGREASLNFDETYQQHGVPQTHVGNVLADFGMTDLREGDETSERSNEKQEQQSTNQGGLSDGALTGISEKEVENNFSVENKGKGTMESEAQLQTAEGRANAYPWPRHVRMGTPPQNLLLLPPAPPPGASVGKENPLCAGVGLGMNVYLQTQQQQQQQQQQQHQQGQQEPTHGGDGTIGETAITGFLSPAASGSQASSYTASAMSAGGVTPLSASGNTPPYHMLTGMGPGQTAPYALPQYQQQGRSHVHPILYSAIGSLERYNVNSLGGYNNRVASGTAARRDFGRIGGSGMAAALVSTQKAEGTQQNVSGGGRYFGGARNSASDGSQLHGAQHTVPYQARPQTSEVKKDIKPNEKDSVDTSQVVKGDTHIQHPGPSGSQQKRRADLEKGETEGVPQDQKQKPAKPIYRGNLKKSDSNISEPTPKSKKKKRNKKKKVTIDTDIPASQQLPAAQFRPSCDAYTPRMERKSIAYKPAEMRTPVQKMSSTMGSISRPNFRDALRRVAMIIQQHVVKIERRFEAGHGKDSTGLFDVSMRDMFCEENFRTPKYKCTMVRVPMARPGAVYGLRKIQIDYTTPTAAEIYEFAHQLFKSVQLSSECSIVCLIYVERLMEQAKVPLMANTWRPIFMCGLLLASKVWQDLSSWNIEFASVYPQFSLDAINRLELQFLRMVKWDLYISSSLYAKYYFALRSLLEKQDFRQRYNRMVGGVGSVDAAQALKIQKRTEMVKEEALLQLSRSM